MIGVVKLYQVTLSPIVGGQCRFRPTCSQYAIEALREHGPIRGGWMTASRIVRCNPLTKGGYDPVKPRGCGCKPRDEVGID
ncbi:MAG: membrane protein insertion efficiency factor YidD [Planctomycetota bacterium]